MSKVVLITGASSGIGRASARTLVARGHRVAMFARSADKLAALRIELGEANAIDIAGSVTEQIDLDRAVARTIEKFGRLDAVFANAGVFGFEDLASGNPDDWAKMVDTNINGTLRTVRAALPPMIERGAGTVILTASIAGRTVFKDSVVYAGTKHFVYALAVGLRKQVVEHGIGVSVISPGYTLNELWGEQGTGTEKQIAEAAAGRVLLSENVADAVAYILEQPANVNIADLLLLPVREDVAAY